MGCLFSSRAAAEQEKTLHDFDTGASEVRATIEMHKRALNENDLGLKQLVRSCDGKKPAPNSPQEMAIVAHLKKREEIRGKIKEEETRLRTYTRTADGIRRMQLNKKTVKQFKKLDEMVRSFKLDAEATEKVINGAGDAMAEVDEYNRAVEDGMQEVHAATVGRSPLRDAPDDDGGLDEKELKRELDDLFSPDGAALLAAADTNTDPALIELTAPPSLLGSSSVDANGTGGQNTERASLLPTRTGNRVLVLGVDTS